MSEEYRIKTSEIVFISDKLSNIKRKKYDLLVDKYNDDLKKININISIKHNNGDTTWIPASLLDILRIKFGVTYCIFDPYTGLYTECFSLQELEKTFKLIEEKIPTIEQREKSIIIEKKIIDLFGDEVWEDIEFSQNIEIECIKEDFI